MNKSLCRKTCKTLEDICKPWKKIDSTTQRDIVAVWLTEYPETNQYTCDYAEQINALIGMAASGQTDKDYFFDDVFKVLTRATSSYFEELCDEIVAANKANGMQDKGATFVDEGDNQYWKYPNGMRRAA